MRLGYRVASLCLLLSTACAFMPHTVVLDPQVEVSPENIGHKRAVSVRVTDERPGTTFGNRMSGYGPAADIRSQEGNVVQAFDRALRNALRQRGFEPAPDGQAADSQLKVEVRSIDYKGQTGFFTAGITVQATAKAIATGPCGYEQLYRYEDQKRIVLVPTAASDSAAINRAVSSVIQRMVSDKALFECLAKPS